MQLFTHRSLRSRLILTYLGLIIIGFGGLTWLAGQQVSQGSEEDFANNLKDDVFLVSNALAETLEHYAEREVSRAELMNQLQQLAAGTNTKITLFDPRGQAWISSSGQTPDKQISVPSSLSDLAIEQTISRDGTYQTIAPIIYERSLLSFVQLSASPTQLQETISQRLTALGLWFIVFLGLAFGFSLWLASTLTKPLSQLRDAALVLAQGDLSQRIVNPGTDEIGAVAEAFNYLAIQVEAMVEEQRAFASNVSHELRTPLTTIRLRTEWLKSGELDAETTRQYIAEVDSEAVRLSGLVDDLILLSRLDANRLTVGQEQVDVGRLIAALGRELLPFAAARGVDLQTAVQSESSLVRANLNHLRVVFRNLLENAIKYTGAGGGVRASLVPEYNLLKITIEDNGQGISAADLTQVHKRFYRADKARLRQTQGVGLGLALVQSIVDTYGGRFEIDSPGLGQGTTVTVWWPLK